jgi:hypothetical protein
MPHARRKKQMQQVAFDFICGSTKCETLVIFLREVLDASQNAGLIFLAAVFDMGANNDEAL